MSITNVSDLYAATGGALILPTRSEKVVVATLFQNGSPASGSTTTPVTPGATPNPTAQDFIITAAEAPQMGMSNYITIRIAGRSPTSDGVFSATDSACYWFLINPSEAQISRQTLDEQTLTRGGWQIGIQGEDFITITLTGKTPGKYFEFGTTDYFTQGSLSYRNLLALELLFENNGYWFEGEQIQTSLSSLQATKRIKMHADVELTVGEFIWYGMFETFEITEDADTPFTADFTIVFSAWKETFRKNTPYPNSIGGDIQRGHVPVVYTTPSNLTTGTWNSSDTSNANTAVSSLITSNTV